MYSDNTKKRKDIWYILFYYSIIFFFFLHLPDAPERMFEITIYWTSLVATHHSPRLKFSHRPWSRWRKFYKSQFSNIERSRIRMWFNCVSIFRLMAKCSRVYIRIFSLFATRRSVVARVRAITFQFITWEWDFKRFKCIFTTRNRDLIEEHNAIFNNSIFHCDT